MNANAGLRRTHGRGALEPILRVPRLSSRAIAIASSKIFCSGALQGSTGNAKVISPRQTQTEPKDPFMTTDFVSFPVPADRVGDVARYLYGSSEAPEAPEATDTSITWRMAKPEELKRIYLESEPRFRKLMLLIANRPDPEVPMLMTEVTEKMGWDSPRSLPGALGAFGRRTKHRYEDAWPFVRAYDHETGNHSLWTTPELAEALKALHAELDGPTES